MPDNSETANRKNQNPFPNRNSIHSHKKESKSSTGISNIDLAMTGDLNPAPALP
jgi:hypothetical protein